MIDKEKIKAIIKQYADKGEKLYNESCETKEDSQIIDYWDGYGDCANLLLRELDSMQEEPQVKESAKTQHVNETCKENGNSLTQEPISDDLEQAIDTYLATYFGGEKEKQEWPFLKKMAIHFANWQKKKDDYAIEIAHMAGEEEGKNIMKQQLMAKAVDATVHSDAGGYPYIPQMELYNYEKDIPFAKEGDKYKVILIKED